MGHLKQSSPGSLAMLAAMRRADLAGRCNYKLMRERDKAADRRHSKEYGKR
jgi:hypothetical protein